MRGTAQTIPEASISLKSIRLLLPRTVGTNQTQIKIKAHFKRILVPGSVGTMPVALNSWLFTDPGSTRTSSLPLSRFQGFIELLAPGG